MKNILPKLITGARMIVYGVLYFCDVFFGHKKLKVVIFCYHAINSDTWKFSIDKDIFKKQINYLLKDRKAIGAEDLLAYLKGNNEIKDASFLLCFDDGYRDILQVRDFLQAKKIKPLLFVLSQSQKVDYSEIGTNREFLNDEEIKSLKKDGWDIGSHSATHRDFAQLEKMENILEIVESRRLLQKNLGFPIDYFAYPRGRYDREVVEQVEYARYKMAFSMDDSIIDSATNRYVIPRVGVDRTHSFLEFKFIYSRSVVQLRGYIKKSIFFKKLF